MLINVPQSQSSFSINHVKFVKVLGSATLLYQTVPLPHFFCLSPYKITSQNKLILLNWFCLSKITWHCLFVATWDMSNFVLPIEFRTHIYTHTLQSKLSLPLFSPISQFSLTCDHDGEIRMPGFFIIISLATCPVYIFYHDYEKNSSH